MKKSTISKQWSYTTDLFSTLAVKSRQLSMLWLIQALYALVDVTHVVASAYQHGGADYNKRPML